MTDTGDEILRQLAREAMSVGWYSAGFFRAFIDEDDAEVFSAADARFMAAVTPQVVLRILAIVAAARDYHRLVMSEAHEVDQLESWARLDDLLSSAGTLQPPIEQMTSTSGSAPRSRTPSSARLGAGAQTPPGQ
jgi:hypothetical protein